MEPNKFYASLPKKYLSAGALIFNQKKEILLVKPNYKPKWSFPGGAADKGESLKATCLREVREEIGLDININGLLLVSYFKKYVPIIDKENEYVQFIFYGGIISKEKIRKIRINHKELSEYTFATSAKASQMMRGGKRQIPILLKAQKNRTCYYLER